MTLPLTGFIGLGHMGGALARRLMQAGHRLVVHDLQSSVCEAFAGDGARVAGTAREVADCAAVVFLSLPSVAATQEVAAAMAGGARLRVLVETSTVGPTAVRRLVQEMTPHHIDVLDCPVSGGPRSVQAGKLVLMHSGVPAATEVVLPLLNDLAGRLIHMGDTPGLAQVAKLVNNAISAAGMVAACEAMVLGVKAGLDAQRLLNAVNAGSGRNSATLDKFPISIMTGTFDFGGPLGLMVKDLSLFLEEAQRLGVHSALIAAVLEAWQEAVRRSGAESDYSRVIRHFEIDAGVSVRAAPQE